MFSAFVTYAQNSDTEELSTKKEIVWLDRGYQSFWETGYAIGVGDWEANMVCVTTSHGIQFNPRIYLGLGFGILGTIYPDEMSEAFFPVFADFRWTIAKTMCTPFVDMRIGGVAAVGSEYFTGGMHLNPSVGLRVATHDDNAVNLSIGYMYSDLTMDYYDDYFGHVSTPIDCGSFSMRIGFEF